MKLNQKTTLFSLKSLNVFQGLMTVSSLYRVSHVTVCT